MCQYFSCIITKELKVHWSKKTMGHEELLDELHLEDKKLQERDFVRIEITPKDRAKVTRNPDDWNFKIDENKTVPNWYEKNVVAAQKACWEAWKQSVQINLALDKEEIKVTDTLAFAHGSSKVVAYGSSKVEAYHSSKVEAYDSSKVVAYDSSKVVAYDSSKVEAYDSSKVELKSSMVAVLCQQKIFVSEQAIVVRASVIKANEV